MSRKTLGPAIDDGVPAEGVVWMGSMGRQIVGEHADDVIGLLNRGVAAELCDAYRYLVLSKLASGMDSPVVAEVFADTAEDEWRHISLLLDRLIELGGTPMSGPSEVVGLSHTAYRPPPADPADLRAMLADSLEGERAAIVFYHDLYQATREYDPITAQLARQVLADEVADEDELERLLAERSR